MCTCDGGVAFFDSGIGGLTVLAECQKIVRLPFYYYGDNAFAPYGNRSPSEIYQRTLSVFSMFARMRVRVAVVACNTATAVCVDKLRNRFPFPIVGVEPAVRTAAKIGGEVFVLATPATCKSHRFQTLCNRVSRQFPKTDLRPFSCERLAAEIEKNVLHGGFDCTHLLPEGKPSAVVLGCTHYVYCKNQIAAHYGCNVYDGNEGVARRLQKLLFSGCVCDDAFTPPTPDFFVDNCDKKPCPPPACATETTSPVFFLGLSKHYNRQVYEQMFAKNR